MRMICRWIVITLLASHATLADQQQPAATFVLGYANKLSCVPGEEISFHLSSSGDSVRMVIERQGGTNETMLEKPMPNQVSQAMR